MASTDFETEKVAFRAYYDANYELLGNARNGFASVLAALLPSTGSIPISKIEGRVKEREECIRKFNQKYRPTLEEKGVAYTIREHITDLVGLRIVCLYEDDIEEIGRKLSGHFEVLAVTDKITTVENTEGSFGYKGLHFDFQLQNPRLQLPEYALYASLPFEVQVRTIIQDSWSVLDHKIKYKKAIPNRLKRRINTLAALFELADREFRAIRDATEEEIKREETAAPEVADETDSADVNAGRGRPGEPPLELQGAKLNAFNFLRIARHFFPQFDFEPYKVDGFVQEIVSIEPEMTRAMFNRYVNKNIATVKRYQAYFESLDATNKLNPFTVIRHCLFLADRDKFSGALTATAKEAFTAWLRERESPAAK